MKSAVSVSSNESAFISTTNANFPAPTHNKRLSKDDPKRS
jgi:hypothetical protein